MCAEGQLHLLFLLPPSLPHPLVSLYPCLSYPSASHGVMLLPKILHRMRGAFNPCLQACTDLKVPTCDICLITFHPEDELGESPPYGIPDYYWVHPRALLKSNNTTGHKVSVCSSGVQIARYPISQLGYH